MKFWDVVTVAVSFVGGFDLFWIAYFIVRRVPQSAVKDRGLISKLLARLGTRAQARSYLRGALWAMGLVGFVPHLADASATSFLAWTIWWADDIFSYWNRRNGKRLFEWAKLKLRAMKPVMVRAAQRWRPARNPIPQPV